jgi:hypothetical protein
MLDGVNVSQFVGTTRELYTNIPANYFSDIAAAGGENINASDLKTIMLNYSNHLQLCEIGNRSAFDPPGAQNEESKEAEKAEENTLPSAKRKKLSIATKSDFIAKLRHLKTMKLKVLALVDYCTTDDQIIQLLNGSLPANYLERGDKTWFQTQIKLNYVCITEHCGSIGSFIETYPSWFMSKHNKHCSLTKPCRGTGRT